VAIGDPYVTFAELKDYAQISDGVDDAVLEQVAGAASRGIERWCRRQFNDAGTVSPRVFRVTDRTRLQVDDFSTLTGLVVATDTTNNGSYATTVANSSFLAWPPSGVLDGVSGYPFSRLDMRTSWWPVFGTAVQVTARWGWAAVPPEVVQATLIKATRVFRRRYAPDGLIGAGDFVFRVNQQMDPDVVDLLAPLRRVVFGVA
jgi:hypothetical protein